MSHLVPLSASWSLWQLAALRTAGMPWHWLDAFAAGDGGRLVLGEQRFLEALAWQNPAATDNWVGAHADALAAGGELPRSGKREALLARYAQRYCAKNDTIGTFGPVSWARLTTDLGLAQHGSGQIRSRTVHVESWALTELARTWATDHAVVPHLPMRLRTTVSFDGTTVRRPWRPTWTPDPLARKMITAVQEAGQLTVADMVADGWSPTKTLAEVTALVEEQVLSVGFVVPLDDHPERSLRDQLGALPAEVGKPLLAQLDELDRLLATLHAAAGDGSATAHALRAVTSWFTDKAGDVRRGKGDRPMGRTPVYFDARRDLDVTIGTDLQDALAEPLAVVLDSARWLAAEVADAVADELRRRYTDLRGRSPDVRVSELYFSAADVLAGSPGTVVHEVVRDFQLRWAELLGESDGDVDVEVAEVESLAKVLFPYRPPRWAGARNHSPDVMLCPDTGTWVLGELHVALNTLEGRVFHTQADDRAELRDAIAADMADGRVVALLPFDSPEVSPRTYPPLAVHLPETYRYWSLGESSAPDGARNWPATDLVLRDDSGTLTAGPVDGSWEAPLLEVLGEVLTALVVDRFHLRSGPTGRVRLGDLVLCRRTWQFPAAGMPLAPTRTHELSAWLRDNGLPRHLFARGSAERKPFYVDLDAPPLVRNLARAARLVEAKPGTAGLMTFVEMLPGPDQLWVRDDQGDRFTAEFRFVAVDG